MACHVPFGAKVEDRQQQIEALRLVGCRPGHRRCGHTSAEPSFEIGDGLKAHLGHGIARDQRSKRNTCRIAAQPDPVHDAAVAQYIMTTVRPDPGTEAMRPASRIEAQVSGKCRRCRVEDHDKRADRRVPEGRRVERRDARIGRESRGPIAGPCPPATPDRLYDPTSRFDSLGDSPGCGAETPGRSRESRDIAPACFPLSSQPPLQPPREAEKLAICRHVPIPRGGDAHPQ